MFVGFFKKDEEKNCKCQVVKFSDRIWLDEKGNASFLRTFVVKVLPDSPIPLTEVKLLLPAEHVLDVKNYNDTFFQPQYFYNQQQLKTTHNYQIVKNHETIGYDSFGIVNDDGVNNIKIFTDVEYALPKLFRYGKCTALRFKLPSEIKPGETVGTRFSFKISSLFDNITGSEDYPEYSVTIPYFCQSFDEEKDELGKDSEIGIIPTLKGDNHPGGFDFFLYLPPSFVRVSGFNEATEKPDRRTMDGTEGSVRLKFGWKLRWLLKKYGHPEDTVVYSNTRLGSSIDINGIIKQRDVSAAELKKVGENVETIPKLKSEVRFATIVAVLALIISIITIIPLGIEYYNKYFCKAVSKTNSDTAGSTVSGEPVK